MDGEQGMVDMPDVVAEVDDVDKPTTVTAASGIKNSRAWSWYTAVLMSLCYGVGELSHFLVGTTSRAMSQDLHYGDRSCQRNDSLAMEVGEISNITCSHYLDENTCNNIVTEQTVGNSYCQWDYNGLGIAYQILAGPSFILAFTIGGLVLGALADRYNRILILSISTFFFSACTVMMGTARAVWQLIILRFGVAFGESACQPVSASLVLTLFPQSLHGAALGLVNWGIYFGYGLSYVFGNYITAANILGQGWRWAYYLSGLPGFIFAAILLITTSDPRQNKLNVQEDKLQTATQKPLLLKSTFASAREFFRPFVLLLCLAACVRHTAGFAWAYNTQLYFDTYYPGYDVGIWLFLVSLLGGSIGILVGGTISDRIVKRMGLQARAWTLAVTQLLAVPFATGTLLLPPPYCFGSLLCAYVFAETWFGILFAILIELVPAEACSFVIAVFLFVMNNVGGNLPVIVDPISKAMGYRETLLLFYPGFYLISSILFGCCGILLRKSSKSLKPSIE